nr:MAG TPA: hypothetical protein [Caudoviricetes sp.]
MVKYPNSISSGWQFFCRCHGVSSSLKSIRKTGVQLTPATDDDIIVSLLTWISLSV